MAGPGLFEEPDPFGPHADVLAQVLALVFDRFQCDVRLKRIWLDTTPVELVGLVANKDQSARNACGYSLGMHVPIAPFQGTRFESEIGRQRDFNLHVGLRKSDRR
jgi:hypothetical protein